MKDYLFSRVINATIYSKSQLKGQEIGNEFHMRFDFKRTMEGETPNAGTLTIYNLQSSTRDFIEAAGYELLLNVGYAGNDISKLVAADIDWADSFHDGVDWITEVYFTESGKAIRNTYMTKAYNSATTDGKVIDDIISKFDGVTEGVIKSFKNGITKNGFSIADTAKDVMNSVVGKQNNEWTIQDNKLHILGTKDLILDTFIELSPETGLIGSVKRQRKEDEKGKFRYITSFTSLLLPELAPGRGVLLTANDKDGKYKVYTCSYTGSNFEDVWECGMEGVAI